MTGSSSRTETLQEEQTLPTSDVETQLVGLESGYAERSRDLGFLPIPNRLRYHPEKPFHFGMLLNIAFGFASTFIVANLYYCQPLLSSSFAHTSSTKNKPSGKFNFQYHSMSHITKFREYPLLHKQVGLVLISPLGDLVLRRQLILILVSLSTCLTIGLAITNNLLVFEALSFLVGMVTVTPQILIPLAADLAPPERRASAISVVLSGLLFGVLIARVLAGVIAEFVSWRVVYYFAISVQFVVLVGSYAILPDYPSKNKNLTYFHILWTMVKYAVTEPILIQACLVQLGSSACFSNFWVTLTFLLGGAPYHYSTLGIGLFGLVGMAGVAMGPVVGHIIDRLVPWYASLFSVLMLICFQTVQVGGGGINIAAVIIATLGLDIFRQMLQVSLSTAIFGISTEARARLNAVSILSIFIGQVMGTSVGTKVFVRYGWRPGAVLSLAWYGYQLVVLLIRGPHCQRYTWLGYEGGLEGRKSVIKARQLAEAEAAVRSSPEKPVANQALSNEKESPEADEHTKIDKIDVKTTGSES